MTTDGVIAIATIGVAFAVLIGTQLAPYIPIVSAVCVLLLLGIIDAGQAFSGFSNEGVVTIAVLYFVAATLRETGVVGQLITLFGNPKGVRRAQARLALPVAACSGFINNTPLVAVLIPAVRDWAHRIKVPASKLLIPLSYASLLGGKVTLIGTSANLVVHGLLLESGRSGMSMFTVTSVGLPCAIAGLTYLLVFSAYLLPDHDEGAISVGSDPREYTVEMVVEPGSSLIGKTIEGAGLRSLPGCYLTEIHRGDSVLSAIGPSTHIEADDQLVFVGLVDSVVDLQRMPGLRPATQQVFKLDSRRSDRWFMEAVVSHHCPIIGQTIRESSFRTRYDAVVLAVARGGARIRRKLGEIILHPGDVLLLEAHPSFLDRHKNSNHFYLVSRATGEAPPTHERAWIALGSFAVMVGLAATGVLTMLEAAIIATAIALATRCISIDTARRAVDWQLLLTIAAAFGMGQGLAQSGAATYIAESITDAAGGNPWLVFGCFCVMTAITSELITNNAAAVLMFPIAMQLAASLGVSYLPFAIGLMLSASSSYATPLGYQTHLMVYGAGGYSFKEFIKVGVPMDVVVLSVIISVTPIMFPF